MTIEYCSKDILRSNGHPTIARVGHIEAFSIQIEKIFPSDNTSTRTTYATMYVYQETRESRRRHPWFPFQYPQDALVAEQVNFPALSISERSLRFPGRSLACGLRGGTESINDIATEMPYNYGREHDSKPILESTHRTHDRIPSQETRRKVREREKTKTRVTSTRNKHGLRGNKNTHPFGNSQ